MIRLVANLTRDFPAQLLLASSEHGVQVGSFKRAIIDAAEAVKVQLSLERFILCLVEVDRQGFGNETLSVMNKEGEATRSPADNVVLPLFFQGRKHLVKLDWEWVQWLKPSFCFCLMEWLRDVVEVVFEKCHAFGFVFDL